VKESLSELIHFRRLNLMDSSYPMKGTFAVIFCRNVIIYFDKETQKRVFKTMHRYLDEDGYLFLGHSENITSITRDYRIIGSTIYSKAPAGA
jgi:chemotaxis protein methyltransferase CheR